MAEGKKSIHAGHRQRMKEEFLATGGQGWPDHRLLELMLFYAIPQGDVNPLAHALLDRFHSLAGVMDAPVEELVAVKGMGLHSAAYLKVHLAAHSRYMAVRSGPGQVVKTLEDARYILAPYFYGAQRELVYTLCMDSRGKLLGVGRVSEGSVWSSEVNLRELVKICMGLNAAYCYLAHNHVSNLALPSQADWETTNTVYSVLEAVGVKLRDHLVFVDGDMVSLKLSHRSGRAMIYQMRPLDDWNT